MGMNHEKGSKGIQFPAPLSVSLASAVSTAISNVAADDFAELRRTPAQPPWLGSAASPASSAVAFIRRRELAAARLRGLGAGLSLVSMISSTGVGSTAERTRTSRSAAAASRSAGGGGGGGGGGAAVTGGRPTPPSASRSSNCRLYVGEYLLATSLG